MGRKVCQGTIRHLVWLEGDYQGGDVSLAVLPRKCAFFLLEFMLGFGQAAVDKAKGYIGNVVPEEKTAEIVDAPAVIQDVDKSVEIATAGFDELINQAPLSLEGFFAVSRVEIANWL